MTYKLRVGVIGTGYWGASWVPVILSNARCELSGVFGRGREKLEQIKQENQLPEASIFQDLDLFLKNDHDLVIVTAHHQDGLHRTIGEKILNHGSDLLMEKPLCDELADAEYLVNLAAQNERRLIAAQNFRYHKNVLKVKEWLAQNVIGEVISADVNTRLFFGPDHPEWRLAQKYPHLLELGIHSIDIIRDFFHSNAAEVVANSIDVKGSHLQSKSFTSAIIKLENGIVVNWSGNSETRGHSTDCTGEWHIYGKEGVIYINSENAEYFVYKDGQSRSAEKFENTGTLVSGRDLLLQACVEHIQDGKEIKHTGKDNLNTLKILFSAIESSEKKEWIQLKG